MGCHPEHISQKTEEVLIDAKKHRNYPPDSPNKGRKSTKPRTSHASPKAQTHPRDRHERRPTGGQTIRDSDPREKRSSNSRYEVPCQHKPHSAPNRGKTEAGIRAAKPNNPLKQRSNPANARDGPMKGGGWGGTAPDTDKSQGGPGKRPPGNQTYPERRSNPGRKIPIGQSRVGNSWEDQSGQETTRTKTTPAGESPQKQEMNLSMVGEELTRSRTR